MSKKMNRWLGSEASRAAVNFAISFSSQTDLLFKPTPFTSPVLEPMRNQLKSSTKQSRMLTFDSHLKQLESLYISCFVPVVIK